MLLSGAGSVFTPEKIRQSTCGMIRIGFCSQNYSIASVKATLLLESSQMLHARLPLDVEMCPFL